MATRDIIGIGGSAGGLAAVAAVLGDLPADLPAAIFIVLHVSETGSGTPAEFLGQRTRLPVALAKDGEAPRKGHAYLGPPGAHLLVVDGVMRLGRGPRENMARPAVDALFRSLALSYDGRTIGVVLSGHLNDGTAGLAAITRCGGLTVAQRPSEAEAPGMPRSAIAAGVVGCHAPLADIAGTLERLVRSEAPSAGGRPNDIALEVEIAMGGDAAATAPQLGSTVPLTCPSCGGPMSQLHAQPPLRFRCQVGHGYTAATLAARQEPAVDEAMRIAMRIVGERAELLSRMAAEARTAGREALALDYSRRSHEYRHHAAVIRSALLPLASADPPEC